MISRVRLSFLLCLSVCQHKKMPVHQIQAILVMVNIFKRYKSLLLSVLILLYTLTKLLKSCILSCHYGHAYCHTQIVWPSVESETMASIFLEVTIQHAFVRRMFVPILIEHMHSYHFNCFGATMS